MRSGPEGDASPVDELLRFISPVQFSRRITLTDTEYGGKKIPKGTMVMAGLARPITTRQSGAALRPSSTHSKRLGPARLVWVGDPLLPGCIVGETRGRDRHRLVPAPVPEARIVDAQFNGRINLRGLEKLTVEV